MRVVRRSILLASTAALTYGQAAGEVSTSYNTYGGIGLIDMPTALSAPDAELAFTSSYFSDQTRNTLTFQVTPRLSGSFRYSSIGNFENRGEELYDRSFSLQYRIIDEDSRSWRPAIAIGLNDFLGTGIYASEYIVATKTLGPGLRLTGGLGWGRLGSEGGFTNPLGVFDDRFETRPDRDFGSGGEVETDGWFRGDAAFFGGVEWQPTERLTFTAEYSSDAYDLEDGPTFEKKSPFNFGLSYKIRPSITIGANYLYGSELGIQATFVTNPKNLPNAQGYDRAPMPVLPRKSAGALGWSFESEDKSRVENAVARVLAQSGLTLHGFSASRDTVRVEIENAQYANTSQAVGRAARALTHAVPGEVDTFVIVPVRNGIAGAAVTLRRNDLETLEHDYDNSWLSFTRAQFTSDVGQLTPIADRYPDFRWQLRPYLSPSLFDPDQPIRADVGLELRAAYQAAPGLSFEGAIRKKLAGNLDESTRESTSVLERVRSDFNIYEREGDPAIPELVGSYHFKPGQDLYGRVTVGYLEPMFGGLSTELLWKPVDSTFAVGAELNYVKQRDFDQLFGFRDYEVATGHVSGYWDMGNGFHSQIDAGRYLAGDWGTTFSLDREFKNGWKVGAFATFTDVSFDDFGEGSFDKGLRFEIPINTITGRSSTDRLTYVVRPVQRDGGARLGVSNRLYETVRDLHTPQLDDGWGRFWK